MSSTYGENIHLSIFGQSHSEAIGMTLDGIPAGQSIDIDRLNAFLARRAPGNSELATPRKEADIPEFLSGFINAGRITGTSGSDACDTGMPGNRTCIGNKVLSDSKTGTDDTMLSDNRTCTGNTVLTCGAPISAIIRNTNTRSKDYSELKITPRPGHADITAEVKYHGFQDYAGGGHFSGRLTAPMCIAGGICLQLLENRNIHIFTRIYAIGGILDSGNLETYIADRLCQKTDAGKISPESVKEELLAGTLPVIDDSSAQKMRELILQKKSEGDSVGGVIECVITGLPAGLGDPMFDGMENRIAKAVFAIPAVKGIEFGAGFASSGMTGSENNDEFCIRDGRIETVTNNCGGILGGITDGMPLVFRTAFKPTPSISKEQQSISLSEMKETVLSVHGRHDPCIVPRALPCVEAAAALAVYDAYLGRKKEL